MIGGKVIGMTWRYGEHREVVRLLLEDRFDKSQDVVFVRPVYDSKNVQYEADINIGDFIWTQSRWALWTADRVDVKANDVRLQRLYGWEGKPVT